MSSESVASVYPAVFLNGLFVTFDSNRVSSAASVYGGVQVQLASECYIRDNDILGGFGHAVTLGGIIWFEPWENSTGARFGRSRTSILCPARSRCEREPRFLQSVYPQCGVS